MIVVANYILRTLFIKLVSCLRENSASRQATQIMASIILVYFFNYCIVYIIAPWSFKKATNADRGLFSGIYTDLTSQWFLDIGTMITYTALLNAIFPVLEFIFGWSRRLILRMWDQRSCCPCDKRKSRAKSIASFEDIYSGPVFAAHYGLAFIVSIVYVAFFYGPGIPILIPITFAGLIINYVTERLAMAYSYMKPPMYDSSLS